MCIIVPEVPGSPGSPSTIVPDNTLGRTEKVTGARGGRKLKPRSHCTRHASGYVHLEEGIAFSNLCKVVMQADGGLSGVSGVQTIGKPEE